MSIFGFLQSLFTARIHKFILRTSENLMLKDTSIQRLHYKISRSRALLRRMLFLQYLSVEVIEGQNNLSLPEENERSVLGEKRLKNGSRLACQTKIRGPVKVRIPDIF